LESTVSQPSVRDVLADRNYLYYLTGNFCSSVGIWVQRVAIGYYTWQLTHSAAWLGIIAISETGPTILLGLVAGTFLDRANHIRVLRITQALFLGYSIVLAVLTYFGLMTVWLLAPMVFFRGTVFAFNRPARQTVVYELVGRQLLAPALALNSTVFNSSKFIGPGIGGVCLDFFGVAWTFAASAALLFVFTVALRLLRVPEQPPRVRETRSIPREMLEGFQYIATHPGVRMQFALMIMVSLCAKPLTDLLPGYAEGIYGRDARGLAWMLGCHGVGAMCGGALLAMRARIQGLTKVVLTAIVSMGVALILFTLCDVFWISCGLLLFTGFTFVCMDISSQTLVQSAIRTRYRGRTMSVYGMISQGVPSIGTLTMGTAAGHFGLRLPVAAGAGICLVLGLCAWMFQGRLGEALESEAEKSNNVASTVSESATLVDSGTADAATSIAVSSSKEVAEG
jgi:MFS family permease